MCLNKSVLCCQDFKEGSWDRKGCGHDNSISGEEVMVQQASPKWADTASAFGAQSRERLRHACMGNSPCQEKKNEAQEDGLMNHRKTHVRIAVANAVMVLEACRHTRKQYLH